jgi:hypothetical protein
VKLSGLVAYFGLSGLDHGLSLKHFWGLEKMNYGCPYCKKRIEGLVKLKKHMKKEHNHKSFYLTEIDKE